MTLAAVSDAGPVIHLAEIESIDLLTWFEPFLIPETVYSESEAGGLPDGLSDLPYELADTDPNQIETELDAGERAAIVVAKERNVVLLTDDLAAREAAADADIEVHGSLGIIALGYGRGRLDRDEAASRMRTLQRETSLFVTEGVVEQGIKLLDEQ